jgi:hypothetical protein
MDIKILDKRKKNNMEIYQEKSINKIKMHEFQQKDTI